MNAPSDPIRAGTISSGNSSDKLRRRVGLATYLAVGAWACWPLALVVYTAFARLRFPFDLEWCEGGSLYQAYRLLHGLPLYTRSDPAWAPFPYPPAHATLLALIGVVRLDFWTGRLVSIAFFALMCWVLFRGVYEHSTNKRYAAVAGAMGLAVVACAYPFAGQWYDLVRVDSMMLALCIWGTSRVIKPAVTSGGIIATAMIFALAIFTKQTAIFFVAWACVFATIHRPRFGLTLGGVTLAASLLLLAVAQWMSHGGFWFWVITNLAEQEADPDRAWRGLLFVLRFAPFAILLPVAALWLLVRKKLSVRSALWMGCLMVAIPASLLPYAKSGGYRNNLMPMLVLLGPVCMLLVTDLAKNQRPKFAHLVRGIALAALAAFVAVRPLDCRKYIPDSDNWAAAKRLNELVQFRQGGVVVPYFAFLPARNGHPNPHWHRMVVLDSYYRGDSMSESEAFERSGARWALILSGEQGPFELYVRRNLNFVAQLPPDTRPHTVTGAFASVDELWEKP